MHARSLERGLREPAFSLILPTYNAGPFLDRTWEAIIQFLRQQAGDWEALFVCDGCSDGTTERLQTLVRSTTEPVGVLSYVPNLGKGYAVRCGLKAARGQWRIFTDVDLAYRFEDVLRVAAVLRGGAEVAIASRLHPESRLVLPPGVLGYAYRRHLQSIAFSLLVRGLLPVSQRDTQAGLKGASARVVEAVLPRLSCNGFGFDCELLTACVRHGVPITEVPVSVRYEDAASTTGLRSIGRMLREIWNVRKTWGPSGTAARVAADEPRRQAA